MLHPIDAISDDFAHSGRMRKNEEVTRRLGNYDRCPLYSRRPGNRGRAIVAGQSCGRALYMFITNAIKDETTKTRSGLPELGDAERGMRTARTRRPIRTVALKVFPRQPNLGAPPGSRIGHRFTTARWIF
jgi:hypothetical protein